LVQCTFCAECRAGWILFGKNTGFKRSCSVTETEGMALVAQSICIGDAENNPSKILAGQTLVLLCEVRRPAVQYQISPTSLRKGL